MASSTYITEGPARPEVQNDTARKVERASGACWRYPMIVRFCPARVVLCRIRSQQVR